MSDKPKPVAPEADRPPELEADLEALRYAAEYFDQTHILARIEAALIAETRAHRASKLTPVGVVTREEFLLELRNDLADHLDIVGDAWEFDPLLEALNDAYNFGAASKGKTE